MDGKGIVLKDLEISKINSLEKLSSLTNLHNNRRTRSFLRNFRKLFMKNKSSMDITTSATTTTTIATTTAATTTTTTTTIATTTAATTTTTITATTSSSAANSTEINYSLGNVELQSEVKILNDSITPLRRKSRSCSDCEDQKVSQKYQRSNQIESKVTTTQVQPNSRKIGFVNKFVTENIEHESTVHSKKSLMGIFSKRWQQSGAINNSYKLLKSEKKKIGRMKMQTDDATDSMRDLRTHTNDNSVFNENAVKKLKAYGCACHVRLHQTYAIIQGYTKFLKLRIHFTYKNIQQIRLIYANERLEQIMIEMAGRKFRFTTKKHIFKDLCQLWHTAITLTNSNKKNALNGSDVMQEEQERLVEKLDLSNDNDGMDRSYSPLDELLSEVTCTTVSSVASPTTTMPNPTDNSKAKVQCQCQSHLGRQFIDEVYPLTTEQLFTILFSSTPWYHHLEEIVNRTAHGRMLNIVSGYMATSWMPENSTVTTRTVTYNMALTNVLGPKSTSVAEKQTCCIFHGPDDGFSVTKEIQNKGIPYADNFIIQCNYCVIRSGHTHSRLLVHGAMIQKKNIWGIVKGIIEKSSYSGLEVHYTVLKEALKLLCDELKQTTVSESEATTSISNNLLANKLLNGKYTNNKGKSVTEYDTSTVPHDRTKIVKPIIRSAKEMNLTRGIGSDGRTYDDAVRITQRLANDAQTQTVNYFSDKEPIGYSTQFVIVLSHIFLIFNALAPMLTNAHNEWNERRHINAQSLERLQLNKQK